MKTIAEIIIDIFEFIKEWVIDTGLLVELLSIALIVPLTAALIERRQAGRLRGPRRLAVASLQFECLSIAQHFTRGFVQLDGVLMTEDAEQSYDSAHTHLISSLKKGHIPKSVLNSSLQTIRSCEQTLRVFLRKSDALLHDCQRACERIIHNTEFFSELLDPEEATALAEIRLLIFKIEESSHTFRRMVADALQYQPAGDFEFADFPALFKNLEIFVERFGSFRPSEPWILVCFDRLTNKWAGPEAGRDFSQTEIAHLTKMSHGLRNDQVMLVSVDKQRATAAALKSARLLTRYKQMFDEIQPLIELARPDEETE